VLKHLTIILAFLMTAGSQASAKDISIICTYNGSYDDNGYEDLTPSDFSVRIKEDAYGNALQASVTESMCQYKALDAYNDEVIRFSGCVRWPWLKADQKTPEAFMEIDRYTGAFKQYTKFPDGGFLMHVGTCRAGSKKF
jgi:hypothetical protein